MNATYTAPAGTLRVLVSVKSSTGNAWDVPMHTVSVEAATAHVAARLWTGCEITGATATEF